MHIISGEAYQIRTHSTSFTIFNLIKANDFKNKYLEINQFRTQQGQNSLIKVKMLKFFIIFILCVAYFSRTFGQKNLECHVKDETCVFESKVINKDDKITLTTTSLNKDFGASGVKEVVFFNSTIHAVPKEIFSTFGNLEYLEADNQSISEIEPNTFLLAKKLIYANFRNNKIQKLIANSFQGAGKLIQVYFFNNLIEDIPENGFFGLDKLEKLGLDSNRISSLHERTFSTLRSLRKIFLHNNLLQTLPDNLFASNLNLEEIHLEDNKIETLGMKMFSGLKKLMFLNIKHNVCADFEYTKNLKTNLTMIEKNLKKCSKVEEIFEMSTTESLETTEKMETTEQPEENENEN